MQSLLPFLLFKLALVGFVVWAWLAAERDLRALRARQSGARRAALAPPVRAPAPADGYPGRTAREAEPVA